MADPISIGISVTALVISSVTAWLNLFHRGRVRMTKPSFIAFSYDRVSGKLLAKIFLRALLYSTGKRGQMVENMFLVVRRGLEKQTFNIWGYGADEKLSRGSGLFVGETGVVANHHFNPLLDLPQHFFIPGDYELSVFVALVGKKKPFRVATVKVTVPEEARQGMLNPDAAVWFDWEPDVDKYHGRVETRPASDTRKIAS